MVRCGAGAVRVRSYVKLFSASKRLASIQRPVGKRLAVVCNCCGPGVLAAGWLCEVGPTLGTFSAETITKLKPQLPAVASLHNLIDLFEEAGTKHHRLAIDAAAHHKAFGGVLVLHPPKSGINAAKTAQAMARVKAGWANRCGASESVTPRWVRGAGCWRGVTYPFSTRSKWQWARLATLPAFMKTNSCCSKRRQPNQLGAQCQLGNEAMKQ